MRRFVSFILGGRLQIVLVASFVLIATLSVGLNALVVSRVIKHYLVEAQDRRVARDMDLAEAFYQLKLNEISAIGQRMSKDPEVVKFLEKVVLGDLSAVEKLDQEIIRKISYPSLEGTHLVIVFDEKGVILVGRISSSQGVLSGPIKSGNWGNLPIVADVLQNGRERTATEVLPLEFLSQLGLEGQAAVQLVDTPLASPQLYDPREGSAGLALIGVYPIKDEMNSNLGAVAVAHLINNDFTLVDRIKAVAGVDTATIFFGDLRVSTNVTDEAGQRAIGTRLSQDVFDVVLNQNIEYKGEAFVVREWFITYYKPLHDFKGKVVGILYVGALKSVFDNLVHSLNLQVGLIALLTGILAGIVAIPISRVIIRPISNLVEANRLLANGDMNVRVAIQGNGELALLGQTFNHMVEMLNKTQQELLLKEKMASMGQLAAGVAHEINNPLGTVLLLSDVLYKETPSADPRRKDLELIISETERCKRIVADLLNFSRQQEILMTDTDINDLLDQVIESGERRQIYKDIEIERSYDPGLPHIQADPAQIKQVFINLLNNAFEAISDGGVISVTTRSLEGGMVEVKIADTGCGIPEENINKLFTPFFTTKTLGKGTGLGLSIVYGIIKMHRGSIFVQSKVGEGSVITVLLPIRHLKEVAMPENSSL